MGIDGKTPGMNIVIFTSSYPRFPGDGTAPFIQSIAEHQTKLGHHVEVVAPFDPEVITETQPLVKVHRFRYIWPASGHIMGHARALEGDVSLRPLAFILVPFYLLGAFLKLMQVTRRQNTQIIHVNWVLPNGPAAAIVTAMRGVPYVVSLHGSDMFVSQRNFIFRLVTRWVFRRAAAVTACSRELFHAAKQLGAPEEIHLLPWGADPDVFLHKKSKGSHSKDEILIIALGRFVYKKGFEILLRAFAELAPRYPNVELIIGGAGPLRKSLGALADSSGLLDRIEFPGRIPWDQVGEFLSRGDIFVLPSVKDEHGNLDGLPTVLLEAMACGLPVVASNIGGVNLVVNDGENGLLVTPNDVLSLTTVLERLFQAPKLRQELGTAAREAVVSTHNWDAVAYNLTEIFEDILHQVTK